ncbi:hypothetical protein L1987_31685 [Smallanthus sonchifolius]|uniref:Uncharacterized protein n=1 Tax=Smallanthus sonchifolius TaxID=185202 RepID=A0ACB9I5N5_9ASTR|nr:hypothetical protein L1987_31685 [Smallanthus sonchifolius]
MKKWEFDSINQAAKCINKWFLGTPSEPELQLHGVSNSHLLLQNVKFCLELMIYQQRKLERIRVMASVDKKLEVIKKQYFMDKIIPKKTAYISKELILLVQRRRFSFDYHEKELETEEGLQAMYDRWRDHHKVTEKSPERFNMFKETAQHVHSHNKMNKPYKLKINKFAAMSDEEFKSTYASNEGIGELKMSPPCFPASQDTKQIPPRMDWREKNAVTPVKELNGIHAYLPPAVAAIESVNAIKTGQLLSLSDQQVLDCYPLNCYQTFGVFDYVKDVGIGTAESYPYKGKKENCDKAKFGRILVTIDGYQFVGSTECDNMKAISEQPVVFLADAYGGPEFRSYSQGVYDGPCKGEGKVAMLLVGYDEAPDGTKYWIAKSTFGESWGEKGYIRLKRTPEGICNMYAYNLYPTKSIETRNVEL